MNKYTNELKRLLKQSEYISIKNKHLYVSTIHFLLSILNEENNLSYILNKNKVTCEKIKPFIQEGTSETGYCLYSKELLQCIENIILNMEDINEEISSALLLTTILESKETECYKILSLINVDIPLLINELKNKEISSGKLMIKELAINLNKEAKINNLDKVIGRDKEIERVIELLARKNKNNPILIGEAGVGKTAIVEELARRIVNNEVPEFLKSKTILSLNLASVIAGTKYRGEFEEKLTKIISELESTTSFILFIDEIHTVMGAGGAEGAIDASNILKPALARGKIRLIGATTSLEYKNTIEKDKALDRRFQKVIVKEPTKEETKNIIKRIKKDYENYHNVSISNDVINTIVDLSTKYIKDRHEPDKSIDILDEICALASVTKSKNNKDSSLKKLQKLKTLKKQALQNNNLKEASKLKKEIDLLNTQITSKKKKNKSIVNQSILKKTLENKTLTPIYELESKSYLTNLNKDIKLEVLYQDEAIDKITEITNYIFSNNLNKPVSILIKGAVGSGTNYLAETYSKLLKLNTISIEGSELSSSISINKIIGSPAGYVGYNEKNTIFENIKTFPVSIIIFRNYELICEDALRTIESILSEGILKLANNEIIDFSNSIFIFTSTSNVSNVGFLSNDIMSNNKFNFEIKLNKLDESEIIDIIKKKYPRINITKALLNQLDYKNLGLSKIKHLMSKEISFTQNT